MTPEELARLRGHIADLELAPPYQDAPPRLFEGVQVLGVQPGALLLNGGRMRWAGQDPATAESVIFEQVDISQIARVRCDEPG